MEITTEDIANIIAEEIEQLLTEKCWPGYEKKGMKKMFGKMYPNCVKKKKKKKKNEEVEVEEGKMSRSYCMDTPCKDMGFSQRASCAKYKKCPSPRRKSEGKHKFLILSIRELGRHTEMLKTQTLKLVLKRHMIMRRKEKKHQKKKPRG